MSLRAVVFDTDGSILDTESTEWQSWREVYEEHGHELPAETWAACVGRPSTYLDPYAHP